MTDQRPITRNDRSQPRRVLLSAAATAAIPAVVLSSAALAMPAQAAELPPRAALQPKAAIPGVTVPAAAFIPASQVAAQLPAALRTQTTPSTHKVRAGETISGIAARYGLSTKKVLSLNGLSASTIIHPGQKIKLGGSAPAKSSGSTTAKASSGAGNYTVKSGDTLSGIAAKHGMSLSAILSANSLKISSVIYPGQKIKVNGGSSSVASASVKTSAKASTRVAKASSSGSYTVKSGDTLSGIAAKHGMSLSAILSANSLKSSSVIYPGQKIKVKGGASSAVSSPAKSTAKASTKTGASSASGTYTVKPGDTLSGIAARHGMSLSAVLSANNLKVTSVIHPGQKIKVTGASVSSASTSNKAPAKSSAATGSGSYTVKSGDTLSGIAGKLNVTLSSLLQASGLKSTSIIYPGQKISVPGNSTGSQTTTSNVGTASTAPLVPSTFLHYTYPEAVVSKANENKRLLLSTPQPSQAQMKDIIAETARKMGVDPKLALAHAYQESGFQQTAVSPANAIGAMQVIPSSGEWASDLVGRKLNLLDPYDNATAGVAIIRSLVSTSPSLDIAIASYYQGQYGVMTYGMYKDTKAYVAAVKSHMKKF
ncbi:LysM peptidoglycan-binding domain-containing protein [Arthrobacter sulfonylureivorans]|uniref:LysM peptidoglycan-binding domain-containing protein n=1 Tax=Arthrobacter sulfonylureivorans TaxID=2486855 RepID=UPI0039E226F1